jgi:ribose 1,5-bisphosphokinase PhnN
MLKRRYEQLLRISLQVRVRVLASSRHTQEHSCAQSWYVSARSRCLKMLKRRHEQLLRISLQVRVRVLGTRVQCALS